ncbi:hypothetical protein FB45DRAFT_1054533 [Roridomyces roridus]|uniref:Uncharacterized protein n=1 Tax=Roridomyces roridus TaxID=1738132 RepID=A0AAD7C943_9AGAR|nr:hypothetical protein FB45DRAFT_1054533 [Roridomyces roridus]
MVRRGPNHAPTLELSSLIFKNVSLSSIAILILSDSYLFVLSAGLLIFGIGLDSCQAGIFTCVLFYTTSKILLYCFLMYLACMGVVGLYVGVIIAMILGAWLTLSLRTLSSIPSGIAERIAEFRAGDNACVIGLNPRRPCLCWVMIYSINVTLTCLFIWPIFRLRGSRSATLRRVALRTFIASLAALTTSTVNIAVLTALHGPLFWVTTAPPVPSSPPPKLAVDSQQRESQTRPSESVPKAPGMVERSGSQSKSKLKPLQLLTGGRENATTGSLRSAPGEFRVHVSTTSMTETSPRNRTGMLPPVDVLPPLSPVEVDAKRESGAF